MPPTSWCDCLTSCKPGFAIRFLLLNRMLRPIIIAYTEVYSTMKRIFDMKFAHWWKTYMSNGWDVDRCVTKVRIHLHSLFSTCEADVTHNVQQMALAYWLTFYICFDDDNKNCDIYISTRYDFSIQKLIRHTRKKSVEL